MNKLLTLFLILMSIGHITAQITAQKPYFQQIATYKIDVTLDDKKHLLSGNLDMYYENNSSESLPFLYILLPANAYKSQKSAYARQVLKNGDTRFYFAEAREMGNFSNLNIAVNGQRAEVEIDKDNPDIAKIMLAKPLLPREKLKISTPFTYKMPFPFSRGGHAGQQYMMTQWYPRVAVYDRDGWHPQPYLDQGEFYAEFGDFDVTLNLPDNYVVGATGVLQTASERAFIDKKVENTEGVLEAFKKTNLKNLNVNDSVPASSTNNKKIQYIAKNVIDFAWFADKRFMVLKGDTTLKSGRKVETYTYFPPKFAKTWYKSLEYINRAIGFYSENVGEYPHPQASAVMTDEGFGGGMEYPMITALSGNFQAKDLDGTIAHEVGHNWFQGILASNERDHAWLDEGLNSFYDNRYFEEIYGKSTFQDAGIPAFIGRKSDYTLENVFMQKIMFNRRDQAPETTSDDLTPTNYGASVYEKTAMSLKILEKHVGRETFDNIMKKYYEKWKFKHPQPSDFKTIWLEETKTIGNIDWFFDDMIGSTKHVDYAVQSLDKSGEWWKLTVKNVGQTATPFTVSAIKKDSAIFTTRLDGIAVGATTTVLIPPNDSVSMVTIDFKNLLNDVNRSNNNIRTRGILPKFEPLRVGFLFGIDNSRRTNVYATPIIAANVYDGFMLGAWFHNGILPAKKLEWSIAPMYSFGAKTLAGVGNIDYVFFAHKNKITLDLGARQFAFESNKLLNKSLVYNRVTPSVIIEFQGKPTSPFSSKLEFRHLFINQEDFTFDSLQKFIGKVNEKSNITELSYSGLLKNALGNTSFKIGIENQQYTFNSLKKTYTRLTLDMRREVMYQRGKRIYARVFLGGFLKNTGQEASNFLGLRSRGSLGLVGHGFNDYKYDGLWLGRNEQKGVASQQIDVNTEGGMKFTLPEKEGLNFGFSNNYVASLNLKMDLPVKFPRFLQFKPYFDIGYFKDVNSSQNLLMSGGIAWELFGDAAAIYFPVYFNGKALADDPNGFRALMERRGKYINRITFSLDLKKINPLKFVKNLIQ